MFSSLYQETSLLFSFEHFSSHAQWCWKVPPNKSVWSYGSMSEQLLDCCNRNSLMNQQGGTGMTAHMVGYPFFDTTQPGQLSKLLIHFRVTG